MSIFLIIGTRPQIIKSAPIIQEGFKEELDIARAYIISNGFLSNVWSIALQNPSNISS
jgi:UDP-N-acetylglucosamine 2-epimerase